jgi:hypothetical protein
LPDTSGRSDAAPLDLRAAEGHRTTRPLRHAERGQPEVSSHRSLAARFASHVTPHVAQERAALIVFTALLALYALSLAPDVTLWDAGEFNAAIGSLGIPHPPGTPLYILVARVWSDLLPFLSQAVAVNALSATATAAACALLARLIARWTGDGAAAVAGGLAAGTLYSVWQNATETEVYALAFLLAVVMVTVGERAGRTGAIRDRTLLAFTMGLAIPLQISALVGAPAAIALAAWPAGDAGRRRALVSLGGAFLLVVGLGLVKPAVTLLGLAALGATALPLPLWRGAPGDGSWWRFTAVAALGASAALCMYWRAGHDPGVNQGNASTWQAFVDVVARRQYAVPGLWPRRAPLWLQLGNVGQYADWQVAFGLSDDVAGSWKRTPFTLLFGVLAVLGALWQWGRHPRGARAVAVLLAAASLGVVAVLNLRAGPSFGAGVLPPGAGHEPRERDYFFALAFATAGLWAGAGAVATASRFGAHGRKAGIAMAALPALLNWPATNRRRLPDAALPTTLGAALLSNVPANAVLLLAGDNDSYAVWYRQQVHGQRRDVLPVTLPLLGADWYRAELARRGRLLDPVRVASWTGESETLAELGRRARSQHRPLAASVAVPASSRAVAAALWEFRGMTWVALSSSGSGLMRSDSAPVELSATRDVAGLIARAVPRLSSPARDATGRYIARLLACPARALEEARPAARSDSGRTVIAAGFGC